MTWASTGPSWPRSARSRPTTGARACPASTAASTAPEPQAPCSSASARATTAAATPATPGRPTAPMATATVAATSMTPPTRSRRPRGYLRAAGAPGDYRARDLRLQPRRLVRRRGPRHGRALPRRERSREHGRSPRPLHRPVAGAGARHRRALRCAHRRRRALPGPPLRPDRHRLLRSKRPRRSRRASARARHRRGSLRRQLGPHAGGSAAVRLEPDLRGEWMRRRDPTSHARRPLQRLPRSRRPRALPGARVPAASAPLVGARPDRAVESRPVGRATQVLSAARTHALWREGRRDAAVAISRCGAGEFAPARGGDPRPPPSHAPQRAEDAFGVGIDQLNPAVPEAVDETLSPPGPDVTNRQEHQGHGTRHPSDARRMVGGLCSALGSRSAHRRCLWCAATVGAIAGALLALPPKSRREPTALETLAARPSERASAERQRGRPHPSRSCTWLRRTRCVEVRAGLAGFPGACGLRARAWRWDGLAHALKLDCGGAISRSWCSAVKNARRERSTASRVASATAPSRR